MLLWIGFAVMTAAVVAALARPLGRARDGTLDSRAADIAVYRDQLTEIEAERSSGLIGEAEAEAARAEVARRMLARAERKTDDVADPTGPTAGPTAGAADAKVGAAAPSRGSPVGALAAMAAIPIMAALVYLLFGSPWLPDQPHSARVAAGKTQVADLIAKVEQRLKAHPEDGQGWDVLAPVYRRFERFPEAVDAYRRAIALLGATPQRLWGLAESLIATNNGLVPSEARDALEKVVAAEPGKIDARYWLAAAKEQDGKREAAGADYKALLPDLPADSPWRKAVEERLSALGVSVPAGPAVAANGPTAGAGKGPTAADMAAAERMTPQDRSAMIERMVAGLAERLKTDGRDLAGWQKLVRAYKVMGREGDARRALGDARGALKGDARAEAELEALAASLGLGG